MKRLIDYPETQHWLDVYAAKVEKLDSMTEAEVRRLYLDIDELRYWPQGRTIFTKLMRLQERVNARLMELEMAMQEVG